MADVKIPEARFIDERGRTLFVHAPGTPSSKGSESYYAPKHRGHLMCPDCDAPVYLREGKKSSSGSSLPGRTTHFALYPGARHDATCSIENSHGKKYTRPKIDHEKGYRIHINTRTYSELFNEKGGVYGIESGRVIIRDPDLKDREIWRVNTVKDIVKLMERGDHARLNDSVVIFNNRKLDWQDFFVRPDQKNGHSRYVSLLKRIEALPKGQEAFCLMSVTLEQGKSASFKDRKVRFPAIPIMRQDGTYETIMPGVYLNNFNDTYVRYMFAQPGTYLVMGAPSVFSHTDQGEVRHYLSIPVESREAVIAVNFDDILGKGSRRQAAVTAPSHNHDSVQPR